MELEKIQNDILLVNNMSYELDEKLKNLRKLRQEFYGFIRKFRGFLAAKCSNIVPRDITTEEEFSEIIPLVPYEEIQEFTDEKRETILQKCREDLTAKKRFLFCKNICLLYAEKMYENLIFQKKMLESLYEGIELGNMYRAGRNAEELKQKELIYAPGITAEGGVFSFRVERLILLMIETKKAVDEVVFTPLHQIPIGQISLYNSVYLYKKLQKAIDCQKQMEKAVLLPFEGQKAEIKVPFEMDPLFMEHCDLRVREE